MLVYQTSVYIENLCPELQSDTIMRYFELVALNTAETLNCCKTTTFALHLPLKLQFNYDLQKMNEVWSLLVFKYYSRANRNISRAWPFSCYTVTRQASVHVLMFSLNILTMVYSIIHPIRFNVICALSWTWFLSKWYKCAQYIMGIEG